MNRRMILVELVGSAGAGKTTLEVNLCRRDPRIRTAKAPSKMSYAFFFAVTSARWLPTYIHHYRHSRWFKWREIMLMGHLELLYSSLQRQECNAGRVMLVNPGAACWLTQLCAFGPEITKDQSYSAWWDEMLARWSARVELYVYLDAPDPVLVERVTARDTWREFSEQSNLKALENIAQYRRCYGRILARLTASGDARLLRFDTAQESPDQIAEQVLAALDLERPETRR